MKGKKIVVVANGEFPKGTEALNAIRDADVIVCCDGSVNKLCQAGFMPTVAIGDGDSYEIKSCPCRYIKIEEQENNDLTKAVKYIQQNGGENLVVVGATGEREDHTIGNVFLLAEYLLMEINVKMITDYGTFVAINRGTEFESFPRQQVSIFNVSAKKIDSQGLQYPTRNFTALWQGTLNQAQGDKFSITPDGIVIVYTTHNPK